MSSKTASKHLTLGQCLRIKANWFRSSDCRKDYQAEEIEARIIELVSKKDEAKSIASMKVFNRLASEAMSVELPPELPLECCEGQVASMDWIKSALNYKTEWKSETYINDNGGIVCIPPQILEF